MYVLSVLKCTVRMLSVFMMLAILRPMVQIHVPKGT